MGYSVRTSDWRYTVWLMWNGKLLVGDFDRIVAEELYKHQNDDGTNFDQFENVNVVDVEEYVSVRSEMFQRAKNHWSRSEDSALIFTKRPEVSGADPVDQFELWDE